MFHMLYSIILSGRANRLCETINMKRTMGCDYFEYNMDSYIACSMKVE